MTKETKSSETKIIANTDAGIEETIWLGKKKYIIRAKSMYANALTPDSRASVFLMFSEEAVM